MKKINLTALFLALPALLNAQAPGIQELNEASSEFHNWYFNMSDFVLVLGTLSGIMGGLRIYANWNIGHHRHHPIDTQVIGWFLSCLFLTLVSSFLKALYGV
jgi:hypothetical protein